MSVLLKVVKRALGRIDRNVSKVRAAQPLELSIEIRKVAALQQRIIAEIDARHNIVRAECNLFGLGEEIVNAAVEHQTADLANWHFFLGNDLRRVQNASALRTLGKRIIEELEAQFPLRIVPGLE